MKTTTINLTDAEVTLLLDALNARASRYESMARFSPGAAGPNERKANSMRKLHHRLRRETFTEAA